VPASPLPADPAAAALALPLLSATTTDVPATVTPAPPAPPTAATGTSAAPAIVVVPAVDPARVPAMLSEPVDAALAAAAGAAPGGAASAGGGDTTAASATGALPGAAVPVEAAGAPVDPASADTGGQPQDGSAAALPADGVAESAQPGSAPAAAPAGTAATAATAAAEDAAVPPGSQVARHVAVLRNAPDGAHTMTLVLTPETLGPVEVQVTVSKGTVDLTLRGAHEHGRAALLDSLPDLRRDLETAGLTCARLEVDRDTGGSRLSQQSAQQGHHQGFGDRSGSHDRGDRSRPWLPAADSTGSGPTPPSQRTTSSGVDVRV
jgi:flagellar hook-length control protein FliK